LLSVRSRAARGDKAGTGFELPAKASSHVPRAAAGEATSAGAAKLDRISLREIFPCEVTPLVQEEGELAKSFFL